VSQGTKQFATSNPVTELSAIDIDTAHGEVNYAIETTVTNEDEDMLGGLCELINKPSLV